LQAIAARLAEASPADLATLVAQMRNVGTASPLDLFFRRAPTCYEPAPRPLVFEKDLVVRERHRVVALVLPLLSLALLVAPFTVTLPGFFPATLATMAWSLGFGGTIGLSIGAWLWNWPGRKSTRRVAASRDGILVDGHTVARASQIRSARFFPGNNRYPPTVIVSGDNRLPRFVAHVADENEGRHFLQAIGHDAASRRERFRVVPFAWGGSRLQAFQFAYVIGLTAILLPLALRFSPSIPILTLILALLMTPFFYVVMGGGTFVEIGVDGVLASQLHKKQWIPFADVRSIEAHEGSARFVLADRHVDVAITGHSKIKHVAKQQAVLLNAVLLRAREALEAHRATVGPRALAETLRRADRKKDEWLDALRKLRDGDAAYRTSAVRNDDLWRVVEDPGAPEDARAAAAFVLRRPGDRDAEATTRLRVALEPVASPRLRVALESDDESALDAFCTESEPLKSALLRR
jgi:hypothetical protein